ncbi:MAG: hypothetical protein PHU56_02605 [Candidatus Pacebacteria bacterium]|nr:hypothetical protein [Candidatus Paceibacterota bacterium]
MKNKNLKFKKIILIPAAIMLASFGLMAAIAVSAADPATVNTLGAENVEASAANFRGAVVNDGGCAKMTVWFEYGPTTNYNSRTDSISRSGVGEFTGRANNLLPGVTYHFRAAARNNTGVTTYGSDRTFSTQSVSFNVNAEVQNLTLGDTIWYPSLRARPGDYLRYRLTIKSTADIVLQDIMVNSQLPATIIYKGNLVIKDTVYPGDISRGTINVGNLLPGDSKIITFEAEVAPEANLPYGDNTLSNNIIAYNSNYTYETRCNVIVSRKGVAGASTMASLGNSGSTAGTAVGATNVSTGIGGGIFNSLLLPLLAAGLLVWLFRSRLLGLEEWAQLRKERIERFRTSKKLQRRIEQEKEKF